MPYIAILIFIILILLIPFAIYAGKIRREEFKKTGKYPKGHYLGLGIALGLPLGIPLGLAMDNIAIGPGIGLAMGVAIGAALEKQHEKELRPPTKAELDLKQKTLIFLVALALLGVIAFIATLTMMK